MLLPDPSKFEPLHNIPGYAPACSLSAYTTSTIPSANVSASVSLFLCQQDYTIIFWLNFLEIFVTLGVGKGYSQIWVVL